jgi:hypothetical protein
MTCPIQNNTDLDLTDLGPHIHGMYDHFSEKLGFNKHPTIYFDSNSENAAEVLGKTAYYDPQTMEVHIFTDGRHPKDMLRSIAHELIHHHQNLEGRLDVGGYNGPGYYLENDKLKAVEEEAMLEGNKLLREYEDGLKIKEMNEMSLKEWKNNELNQLLMKKFGLLKEDKMPMKADTEEDLDNDGKIEGDEVPEFLNEEEELEERKVRTGAEDRLAGHHEAYPERMHEEEVDEEEEVVEEGCEEDGSADIKEAIRSIIELSEKLEKRFRK